jgi:hypothetical protein
MPAAYPDVARWRGSKLHIGPRAFFGVTYTGFYDHEADGHSAVRWCSGKGSVKFKIPEGAAIKAVGLVLRTIASPIPSIIRINGTEIFEGTISAEWSQRFELPGLGNQPNLEIEIESSATNVGGRRLRVGLLDAWIERNLTGNKPISNERALMRYAANEGWWAQPEVMFDEILGEPERLRYIIFQGGEPFLVKEFEGILDVLLTKGSAKEVTFEIVSNLTIIKDSMLSKLACLKQIRLGASIDGIGPVLEYIRYIERNIDRFKVLPNVQISFNTAVQAYNLGDVVNILTYCDQRSIDAYAHFLVGPAYLNITVLPKKMRAYTIDRVKAYLARDTVRPYPCAGGRLALISLFDIAV